MRKKKERPKVGEYVEFRYRRLPRTGKIVTVAETGVHFVIKTLKTKSMNSKHVLIPLSQIIRILPSARGQPSGHHDMPAS